jgi:hypothetical protein
LKIDKNLIIEQIIIIIKKVNFEDDMYHFLLITKMIEDLQKLVQKMVFFLTKAKYKIAIKELSDKIYMQG